jgi:hypothetical protein
VLMAWTKDDLQQIASDVISEWLGYETPEPGDPDFDEYEALSSERNDISTIEELREFLLGMGKEPDEYLEGLEG